ncbi:MAG: UDP-3-O-(3-hydroxymyristoyl)glucosamine N-acyltransferase [Betaproteobacteria bacterium]
MKLKQPVSAGWLCREMGLHLIGPDRDIGVICALEALAEDGLSFALPGKTLEHVRCGTVFGLRSLCGNGVSVIGSEDPRYDFIRAQYMLAERPGFARESAPPEVHPSVRIGPGAVVEEGVIIGEGTVVGPNAVLRRGTRVGRWCEIQSGAVIGDAGFGFERDTHNRPLRMIHLGGVRIGDHVQVGALTAIARGALGDTVLEDYVKINNLCHIAHNCQVGWGTIIGACADLCGSVTIGRNCWIAPNCAIRQKLAVGDGAIVGMGAVVVKDVPAGVMVYGNPAKPAVAAKDKAPTGVLPLHSG